jgi:hypothetical protein
LTIRGRECRVRLLPAPAFEAPRVATLHQL